MKPRGKMWNVARWLISRAANLTPEVVYYAEGWPASINEKIIDLKSQEEGHQSPLSTAAIAMSCAAHEFLQVGDTAEITLSGVTRRDMAVGDFEVTIRRTA